MALTLATSRKALTFPSAGRQARLLLATTKEIERVGLYLAGGLWCLWMIRCLIKSPPWTWSERLERDGIGPYNVSRGRETIVWMLAPIVVLIPGFWAFVKIVEWIRGQV